MNHHELYLKAQKHRKTILDMIHEAGSGHPGGSLSIIDVLTVLYERAHHNPKQPLLADRDRIILSAGHLCPALYTVLADHGYFPIKELKTLRKHRSRLQGHPERGLIPGIENTSGPLGQGLPFAVGKALALAKQRSPAKVYCIVSDGEHDEGATWEAVQAAAHYGLSNLCVIIDRNHVQIDGHTRDVLSLRSLKKKYQAAGWKAIEIDGHHYHMIDDALTYFGYHRLRQPFCIIAHTTLGKGVSSMEDRPVWHGKAPNTKELEEAKAEIDKDIRKHELLTKLKSRKVIR